MEWKDECSDLWRELGKKERSEAESPLASEEQGRQKPNPAEKGVITFWKLSNTADDLGSDLCRVYMLGFGGLALLWLSKAAWEIINLIIFCPGPLH